MSAQDVNTRRTHIGTDPTEVALNELLTSAQAAMDGKDYPTAAQKYQDYLAKRPNDAIVHFNLGYAYTAMQKLSEAKVEYEKAIELDPKLSAAYLNLGLTLLATNPTAAAAPLQKATELLPNEAQPKYLLGTALEQSGKFAQASEQYQAAEKLDDKNADIRVALGRLLLAADKPGDAESEFRAALLLHPEQPNARLGLAKCLSAQKKPEAAAKEYETYLASQPQDVAARTEHASLLLQLAKYDDTIAELDRIASVQPEGIDALRIRSEAYLQMKRYDDAIKTLQKTNALAPKDMGILYLLGQAYLQKKDYPDAVRTLIPVAQADPGANDVLESLIMAQYENKNYPAALDGLDLLSKRITLATSAWFIRASCYDKLGQSAQALDAYKKFLEINTDQNNDMYFQASTRTRTLTRELQNKR